MCEEAKTKSQDLFPHVKMAGKHDGIPVHLNSAKLNA